VIGVNPSRRSRDEIVKEILIGELNLDCEQLVWLVKCVAKKHFQRHVSHGEHTTRQEVAVDLRTPGLFCFISATSNSGLIAAS
jgi:hypothetical protein